MPVGRKPRERKPRVRRSNVKRDPISRSDSETAGRDDIDPSLPAEGSAGDATSDGDRSSDCSRSSNGGVLSDRSPSAKSSANGTVPEAETQTELEAFRTHARNVAGIAPLEAILGQDDATSLRPPALAFGNSPKMPNHLVKLVLDGEKSATSAWLASYEAEGIGIPEVGNLSIMCDGTDQSLTLLRAADVRKIPFADVGPEITQAKGEGTLDEWKTEHRDFFARECIALGVEFDPEDDVVVEFVEVLYRHDGARAYRSR